MPSTNVLVYAVGLLLVFFAFIAYASSFWWAPLFGQICSGELALI